MRDHEILIISGKNYKEMTKKILEESCLEERLPQKDSRIGIKPNLVSPSDPSRGATTHTEVVAGIIEYLQERGYKNLVILEGSWVGDKTWDTVSVCGYDKLFETYQVEFCDTQKDTYKSYDCKGMELNICDSAMALDFLINVPVLKGHCQTKITCAMKNMKGLIPNKEKRRFHTLGLHKPIAHLNTRIHQDFIVVDNICGDLDFEDGGNPVEMNRVITAVDPVLCDAYVCSLLQYDTSEVPYITLGEELGIGCKDLKQAVIRCCGCEEGSYAIPAGRKIVELQDAVEEVDSCSACYGYLIPALDRLKEEGLLKELHTKISIGQGYQGKTGSLGIGNCTRGFTCYLKGCPPTENQVYEFLKNYIESQEQ
jgi:uncharacterized protein (DUF362 family)